jgi:hypothetical protein
MIRQAKSFEDLRILLADYLDQAGDDELQDACTDHGRRRSVGPDPGRGRG